MNHFIILLASNSDAEKNMAKARELLAKAFPKNSRFSENHWSDAIVQEGQPFPKGEGTLYLNAVFMAECEKELDEIQAFLKKMEFDMGRVRGINALGRVALDLDLVEWNGEVLRPKDAGQAYYKVCLADLRS